MDGARWSLLQRLFHAAADLDPAAQAAFLDAASADDLALAQDLRAMLREDRAGAGLVGAGVAAAAAGLLDAPEAAPRDGSPGVSPGTRSFGPYRLVSLLGEGGMGVVYKAVRDDLGGTAAIKILRDAWVSPSRRTRFREEQRTLAKLNHPGIAMLFDADALADGTPWFAMEYVEGTPITEFCDKRRLAVRERLALFGRVCEAVRHAHQQLIIHRDLKPTNILVRDDGSIKLLDFGIARSLDDAEGADRTRTGWRAMTPAYASPEQLRGDPLGVDTDVYSLGVVLYELVTGRLPAGRATGEAPGGAAGGGRAGEPEPPSRATRVRGGLRRSEWSDLDVLCATAMHQDMARRYGSVDALLRDLDHFERGEPLTARPDSWSYRTQKFVLRNRAPLGVSAAGVGTIVGLVTWYTRRLQFARTEALGEAAKAQRIQGFMLRLFDGGDPVAGPADDLRVISLFERGVREAESLAHDTAAQAELFRTLGRLYQKLGHFAEADDLLSRAAALVPSDSPEGLDTLTARSDLRIDQARFDEAEQFARQAIVLAEQQVAQAHPLRIAALRTLARVLTERGAYAEAVTVLNRTVALLEGQAPGLDFADTLHELANASFYAGRYDDSEAMNRRALEIYQEVLGPQHPQAGDTLVNLGAIAFERGRDSEAERLFREGLALTERWHGHDHVRTANNLVMLGRVLVRRKKNDEAALVLARALAGRERAYGPVHPGVASVLNELGTLARNTGRLEDAEAAYARMADIYRSVHGERGHYLNGIAASNLGSVAHLRGDFGSAEARLREALGIFTATQGADHANAAIARVKLAATLLSTGRPGEAAAEASAGRMRLAELMAPDSTWLVEANRIVVAAREAGGTPAGPEVAS